MCEFDIAKLHLGPDDILVCRAKGTLSPQVASAIRDQLLNVAPKQKVMVIDSNLELSILTRAEIEART